MQELKARIQLLLRTNGTFEKNPFSLLFINILKKMNVKWGSLQRCLWIIIYLLAEVESNETIFSYKAMLE